ncbi:FkbM family methyltransferase [Algoriphagus iocasae]|uniref:FkbM family methyltransferase n=1 Tax=Algoriphagus iocasae TaxID=1836499 RepID=A0A841MT43_9BACT|nr:FkbM family methyltransferase [Algoriphagus iocasae]MBB6327814.1 FkbM family methyltransferase [Algoriphagus iocasae]
MKEILIRLLKKFGYRLTKAPITLNGLKVEHDFLSRHNWILKYGIETIIDIGANKGQFAARFRVLFPDAWIYSFEPIPEVYDQLCKRFELDTKFQAFNLGLGKHSGEIDFFQNEFTDSSSALPMKKLHKENFPRTSNEKKIQIKIERLDEIMKSIVSSSPMLIKIDVQGFEEMVILGGKDTLIKASVVIVEVSFYELYENQVFFKTIYEHMLSLAFSYHGNYEQLVSPVDGCVLQADAIFIKENV